MEIRTLFAFGENGKF